MTINYNKTSKVSHVRKAKQSRDHTCHWPGCNKQVPPAMWGCKEHWYKLPKRLRDKIWETYTIGQEQGIALITNEYVKAAREVQEWIKEHYPKG